MSATSATGGWRHRMGIDGREVRVLYRYGRLNMKWMEQAMLQRSNPGLSPQTARVLGYVFLGIPAVILGAFVGSVPLKTPAHFFLDIILSLIFAGSLIYATWYMYTVLLSGEEAAALGWWPLRPGSVVLAKALVAVGDLLIGAAILLGPLAVAWCFRGPVPVVSALGLALSAALCVWSAVLLAIIVNAWVLRALGVRRARNLGLMLIAGAVSSYFFLVVAEDQTVAFFRALIRSDFWPPHWLSLPGAATARTSATDLLWFACHTLSLIAMTAVAFRAVTPRLMSKFSEPAQSRRRGSRVLVRYLGLWSSVREWRIVSWLYIAHIRGDWRFRRHLAALVGGLMILIAFAATKRSIGALLVARDPAMGVFSPGMLVFMAAIVIPMIIFPMLSASSESKAVWIVYSGQIDRLKVALAVRQLVRVNYLYPMLILAAYMYFGTGGATADSVKQFVLIVLTTELAIAIVHRIYDVFPFTQPADIVKTHSGLIATGVLAQFLGFIYVIYIFGLALRFWPVYVLTVAGIVWLITDLNRRFRKNVAVAYERLEYLD